jgi:divalent metal cation (Fe/Co/Zn/Cd) transporter
MAGKLVGGIILMVAGVGATMYSVIRLRSLGSQIQDFFGQPDALGLTMLIVGIVLFIIGVILSAASAR